MTSPLRRKRQITRPGANRPVRTPARRSAISLRGSALMATASLLCLLAADQSWAQSPGASNSGWSAAGAKTRGTDDSALRRASMQPPPGGGLDYGYSQTDESEEHRVQLAPPGPERLFRLESEKSLQERMRQE